MLKKGLILILSLLFAACAIPIKHDPSVCTVDTGPMEKIPQTCQSQFETTDIRIAITPCTNNTTFDAAEITEQSSDATSRSSSRTYDNQTSNRSQNKSFSQQTLRKVNAKLCESIEESLKNELVNIRGIMILSRRDLPQMLSEQQFQYSGLVDEKQKIKLGKIAGAKYIIALAVNNASLQHLRCTSCERSRDDKKKRTSADSTLDTICQSAYLVCKAMEGWRVYTQLTVRLIDVETSEVVFSQNMEGKEIFGQVNNPSPSFETIIGNIKKAGGKAVKDVKPKLSKLCSVKGYIMQTRTCGGGKLRCALINIGSKKGIEPTAKLAVFTFQEVEDPFNRRVSCDVIKLNARLEVTEQVQSDKAWTIIKGKDEEIMRVKTGQLVETGSLSGQGLVESLGF